MENEEIKKHLEYKVSDFVMFLGNINNAKGLFGIKGIARIDKFERFHLPNQTKVRMLITLLKENKQVWVDFGNVQELKAEEKHLLEIGFKISPNKLCYELGGTILTSKSYMTETFPMEIGRKTYITGLCFGNLNNIEDEQLRKYNVNGEFELKELYKDFPSVYNLNRLFDELEKRNQLIDREKVARL